MAPRETEKNAYAKFWGEKQRALWHVLVFSVLCGERGCQCMNPNKPAAAVPYHIVSLRCDNPFSPNRISESLDDAIPEL